MSHKTAPEKAALGSKILPLRPLFLPVKFDPASAFSLRVLTFFSADQVPAQQPVSLVLVPEIRDGNISLRVQDAQFIAPPPNPIWSVRHTVFKTDAISIVLEDNLGDVVVLTGSVDEDPEMENTWNSNVLGGIANGTWSFQTLGVISSFVTRFSWIFVLDGEATKATDKEVPTTVMFEFDIIVGPSGGLLQQISSFPVGWTTTNFDEADGVVLDMTDPDGELYRLKGGLFVGALGGLVCQGKFSKVPIPSRGAKANNQGLAAPGEAPAQLDDGTWTGTSGGPQS